MGNSYHLKDYVNVTPDQLTDISDSRVRKNQTHVFTTNNLWVLGKNTDLSSQMSIPTTVFFLPHSVIPSIS